jgi:hypothetical protein
MFGKRFNAYRRGMQAVKKPGHRDVIKILRKRGMTVSGWARMHGYKPDSVFKILYGIFGNPGPTAKAILWDLEKEGLLKKTDPSEGTRARKSA